MHLLPSILICLLSPSGAKSHNKNLFQNFQPHPTLFVCAITLENIVLCKHKGLKTLRHYNCKFPGTWHCIYNRMYSLCSSINKSVTDVLTRIHCFDSDVIHIIMYKWWFSVNGHCCLQLASVLIHIDPGTSVSHLIVSIKGRQIIFSFLCSFPRLHSGSKHHWHGQNYFTVLEPCSNMHNNPTIIYQSGHFHAS